MTVTKYNDYLRKKKRRSGIVNPKSELGEVPCYRTKTENDPGLRILYPMFYRQMADITCPQGQSKIQSTKPTYKTTTVNDALVCKA